MKWEEYSQKLLKRCKELEIPYHACFELTPFCNFSCNMCYIRLDHNQASAQGNLLTTDQWLYVAKEAKKMGTLSLEITGGEAVTRPDFLFLYESFIKMGFIVNLRSNGYLINGEVMDLLKKYKPRQIGITLYGATDETYNRICGINDGFTVVTNNILSLKNAGLNVHLTMTLTRDNIDEKNSVMEWAANHGLSVTTFGGLFTPIRGAKRSIEHLKIQVPKDEYEILEDSCVIDISDSKRQSFMNPFWMCRGFGAMFCISWDGRMTLCNAMTVIWEEPFKTGIKESYHQLYEDLKKLNRPKKCEACNYIEYCVSCPTQLVSYTGRPDSTCDEICEKARRVYKHVKPTY